MSPQARIIALLQSVGIPAAEVKCYGSQVVVTCLSRDAAERFYTLLGRFCSTVRQPVESIAYIHVNKGTALQPSSHRI